MFFLFTQISRLLNGAGTVASRDEWAQALMEQAGARSGHDASEARELRQAACAYLRVVR